MAMLTIIKCKMNKFQTKTSLFVINNSLSFTTNTPNDNTGILPIPLIESLPARQGITWLYIFRQIGTTMLRDTKQISRRAVVGLKPD